MSRISNPARVTDIVPSQNQPANLAIAANTSAVVLRKLTIASGVKITIGSGAILRIL